MVDLRSLTTLTPADLERISGGYTSHYKYALRHTSNAERVSFDLQLVRLEQPYVKVFDYDEVTYRMYLQALEEGYSFGAYEDDLLVGFVVAERRAWNRSLWVWEFAVSETNRGRGIGRRLMECAAEAARNAGLGRIVCEAQNTNVPAIEVYRKLGFEMEAVDISYYSNVDYPDGEMAVFMKRRL